MKRYNPSEFESKWQKVWSDNQVYSADDFDQKPKFTMLTEFPYPSGAGLHMGHLREYTLGDIIARRKRMKGHNVLFPMGFDAFGLPTENYAIKNKISPQSATETNTANFRRQLDMMGYSIDWNRSFATSDPDYYRWTQWMFLQFYKTGLAYQDEIAINWCPFCKTGLANEEVINGRHERCENLVEKKTLKQWMLRITDYADRLIDGLKTVDYPARIADQQVNWIGRSEGMIFTAPVKDTNLKIQTFSAHFEAFRADTFVVIAPDHPLLKELVSGTPNERRVLEFADQMVKKRDIKGYDDEDDVEGIFTGRYIEDPVGNGDLPIWVASYALANYGTGIVKCSAHDERDFRFAKKYDIKLKPVLFPSDDKEAKKVRNLEYCYSDMKNGVLSEPEEFNGKVSGDSRQAIISYLQNHSLAEPKVSYRLHDWVYSRQHYWGEPIPIIHCPEHGAVAVPEKDLPVELPAVENYEPTDDGQSPLSKISDWINVLCPTCGGPAKRETDTMPNWAGSNWYYLRYFDAHNNEEFADPEKLRYWGAVDLYLGGMEHTTLHLLYSRFHHQFLYDQGFVPTPEPYAARRGQGIILAADGRKMSKSLGNVVDPTQIIESGYGADATRLTVAFLAPYDQTTPWSPEGVAGTYRFLGRVWDLAQEIIHNSAVESSEEALSLINKAIKKVSSDIDNMQFNTAIAKLMETLNGLNKTSVAQITKEDFAKYVQLLAPFAPHMAEEIWRENLKHEESIHISDWPTWDEKYLTTDEMTIAIQVNGKLRGEITVATGMPQDEIENLALKNENVAKFVADKTPAKVIYVPGKIVNIVVK